MQPGISTHVFFQHRLHPGLLDALASTATRLGARGMTIEVFAARHHFDYTDAPAVRELAAWFRSNDVRAVLRQPIYITDRADTQWSRHVAPNLDLIAPEKSHRIAAMDEVKRALESAEQVPFADAVISLGLSHSQWDDAAIEHSLTAIEHLKAFASPLGIRLLLENMENEVTTPEHLLYILRTGHFDSVGVSLDIGHLHLAQNAPAASTTKRGAPPIAASSPWVDSAISLLGNRIAQLHLHDNHGPFSDSGAISQPSSEMKDEHLWPGEGIIDWPAVSAALAALPASTPGILDIAADRDEPAESIVRKAENVFRMLEDHANKASPANM